MVTNEAAHYVRPEYEQALKGQKDEEDNFTGFPQSGDSRIDFDVVPYGGGGTG